MEFCKGLLLLFGIVTSSVTAVAAIYLLGSVICSF